MVRVCLKSPGKVWPCLGVSLFLALSAVGCGGRGGLAEVSGTVTFHGQKLNTGTVTFQSAEKPYATSGQIQPDGTYKIADAPVGPVKIGVKTLNFAAMNARPGMKAAGANVPQETKPPEGMAPPGGAAMPAPSKAIVIPDRWANPEDSGLTYTVTAGSQVHDITLGQ